MTKWRSKKKLYEGNLNVCAGNERCIYSTGVSRDQWAPIKQRDGKVLRHMLWDSHRLPLQFGFVVVQLYLILKRFYSLPKMPAKQRMRVANEKHSQNVTTRGNVPKSLVSSISNSRRKTRTPWKMKLVRNMKLELRFHNNV